MDQNLEDGEVCPGANIGTQAEGTWMQVPLGTLYPPDLKSSRVPFFRAHRQTHLLGRLAVSNYVLAPWLWAEGTCATSSSAHLLHTVYPCSLADDGQVPGHRDAGAQGRRKEPGSPSDYLELSSLARHSRMMP